MQVWKKVDAVSLFPTDATPEEVTLFQSFFDKAKAAKVANFDLFTHRVSGDWHCTDQFIDLLVDFALIFVIIVIIFIAII